MPLKYPIFLDHCSTTPVDESVLEAMLPYFREQFGNPGTSHPDLGGVAQRAVRKAREQVADLLVCHPNEIIWTSGATESNNLAIFGFTGTLAANKRHLITQVTEHSAVLEPLRSLEKAGWKVSYLPVDNSGLINVDQLKREISSDTALVSIMWGNNEIGTIQDVNAIGDVCREAGVPWHCDAAQTVGKVEIDLSEVHAEFLTVSAHKIYGPKGAGALYIRDLSKRNDIAPQLLGGEQEKGVRSGTLNVPGIVGLGHACELAARNMEIWNQRIRSLREQFERQILDGLNKVKINGNDFRLPHISNLSFDGIENEDALTMMPELVASTGSACHTASFQPSHVLKALGSNTEECSLRFGFGKDNTAEEVDAAVGLVIEAIKSCRALTQESSGVCSSDSKD
ncbi:cysteine desulfurase family protein [Mariniblastus fucicola]|uniref:cysteine desulfurase n=1 Tax=Mariniblastus fucicola TaxID=980251 RepID=A0A5B9PEL0_9BACT|nr:cysteine desulfurase family protein [Mariniblastus fucicola]QEG25157.1 Cysteine desulfurase [Mariniblastus fucicola]